MTTDISWCCGPIHNCSWDTPGLMNVIYYRQSGISNITIVHTSFRKTSMPSCMQNLINLEVLKKQFSNCNFRDGFQSSFFLLIQQVKEPSAKRSMAVWHTCPHCS